MNNKALKVAGCAFALYASYKLIRYAFTKTKPAVAAEAAAVENEYKMYDNKYFEEYDAAEDDTTTTCISLLMNKPLYEITPRGKVMMYYDNTQNAFIYCSEKKDLPYTTLDAVARKYVWVHKIKSVYKDVRATTASTSTSTSASAPAGKMSKKKKSFNIFNLSNVNNTITKNINKYIYKGFIEDYEKENQKKIQLELSKFNPNSKLSYLDYIKNIEEYNSNI